MTNDRQLWAYPPGGADRVLVARGTSQRRLEGELDASPDGRWLSVTFHYPVLFRVGSFTPAAEESASPVAGHCSLLRGWEDWSFPGLFFYGRTCFTGDAAFWVGRVSNSLFSTEHPVRCWSLPDFAAFEYAAVSDLDCQSIATWPGTRKIVIEGWSADHDAVAFWVGDLAQPDVPVVEPIGTLDDCNEFKIGADGRFYVSIHGKVQTYSLGARGFRRKQTFAFPEFDATPKIAFSARGDRFVAQCFQSKLVYGGNTETGSVLGPWDWGIGKINDVAIAADGLTAAAAGSSKKLVVWDME